MTGTSRNTVQSVGKAFAVLRAFNTAQFGLTISEIASQAELDRGTTYRLVQTLLELGYLAPVPNTRRFWLTLKCLELGFSALASGGFRSQAHPLLQGLVPRVADAAALGHAILAWEPEDQARLILQSGDRIPLSDRTLTDLDLLCLRLKEVRKRGYAVSDGENAFGLRTVAAPVFWPDGGVRAAVSLTVRTSRQSLVQFIADALPPLLETTRTLADAVRMTDAAG